MSIIFKPKALTQVLSSVNTDGVLCTMLLSSEGSLMAYTGFDKVNARSVAAVANSIWMCFSNGMKELFSREELDSVMINCQSKNVIIHRVGNFLLCSYSNTEVQPGMLRAKALGLVNYLKGPMGNVNA